MINLLATDRKDDLKAARINVILIRYKTIVLLAFAFIVGSLFVSYTVLKATMESAENIISSNDIKADVYSETREQVSVLSEKLNITKTILNQEVRYSQLLVKLGQLMPQGTILGDITLTTASFNGEPLEIKAYAKSTNEAGTLQSAFQSSPLFSQPVTIKGTETNQEVDGYPVTISMSVVLNKAGI